MIQVVYIHSALWFNRSATLPSTTSTDNNSIPTSTTDDFNDSYLDIVDLERSAVSNIITTLNNTEDPYSDISDAEESVTSTSEIMSASRRKTLPVLASPIVAPVGRRLSEMIRKRTPLKTPLQETVTQKRKSQDNTPQSLKKLRFDVGADGKLHVQTRLLWKTEIGLIAGSPARTSARNQEAYQFVSTVSNLLHINRWLKCLSSESIMLQIFPFFQEIPSRFKFNASGLNNDLTVEAYMDNKILNLSSRSNIQTSSRDSFRSQNRSHATPSSVQKNFRSKVLVDSSRAEDEHSNEENMPDVSSYSSLHTTSSSSFSFAKKPEVDPTPDVRGIKRCVFFNR